MIMIDNEEHWQQMGVQSGGAWGLSNNEEASSMPFANNLGNEGFEMFQVVQFGTNLLYLLGFEICKCITYFLISNHFTDVKIDIGRKAVFFIVFNCFYYWI